MRFSSLEIGLEWVATKYTGENGNHLVSNIVSSIRIYVMFISVYLTVKG